MRVLGALFPSAANPIKILREEEREKGEKQARDFEP